MPGRFYEVHLWHRRGQKRVWETPHARRLWQKEDLPVQNITDGLDALSGRAGNYYVNIFHDLYLEKGRLIIHTLDWVF